MPTLTPELEAQFNHEYREHVRSCQRIGVSPESRERYLTDWLADPNPTENKGAAPYEGKPYQYDVYTSPPPKM